jgi:hypothetical protein
MSAGESPVFAEPYMPPQNVDMWILREDRKGNWRDGLAVVQYGNSVPLQTGDNLTVDEAWVRSYASGHNFFRNEYYRQACGFSDSDRPAEAIAASRIAIEIPLLDIPSQELFTAPESTIGELELIIRWGRSALAGQGERQKNEWAGAVNHFGRLGKWQAAGLSASELGTVRRMEGNLTEAVVMHGAGSKLFKQRLVDMASWLAKAHYTAEISELSVHLNNSLSDTIHACAYNDVTGDAREILKTTVRDLELLSGDTELLREGYATLLETSRSREKRYYKQRLVRLENQRKQRAHATLDKSSKLV